MKLSNRTVLVTGGTGGIGLGIAEAFRNANSKVIVCGRSTQKIAAIKEKYPDIEALTCDVGEEPQRKELASEVLRRFPELDVLVNNAGIQRYIDVKKGYEELKSGEDEIAVNFVSVVELTSLFVEHLMQKSPASIINVGSGLGFMPMIFTPVYSATKAAVHTYTIVLRQQLNDTSIKVYEIVPPMVDTDLNKRGRDTTGMQYRGISLEEYIPTVINGLENDTETIFHGDARNIMEQPRGESESRLLLQPRARNMRRTA